MRARSLFNRFTVVAALAALIASAVHVTPARAASIVVNTAGDIVNANDGLCSLREAITAANNNTASGPAAGECAAGSGADTISFAANYTITLAPGLGQLPTVTSPLTVNGRGAANTVIRAHASPNTATARVFQIAFGGNLTLNLLTVRNGRCNGACAGTTNNGGGIYNAGTLSVTNSIINGNSASGLGGGIYSIATLSITNSSLSGNSADSGGGISSSGSLTVVTSTFSANTVSGLGGGIYNLGTLTVSHSTFSSNSANNSGGGIFHSFSSTTANVRNSTFAGNTAGIFGGGIHSTDQVNLIVTNSTLSTNSANGFGASGGGIYRASGAGSVTLRNTIVTNSPAGGNCSPGITNGGNNMDSGPTCGWASNNGSRSNTLPRLGPLANNGGPTLTLALLPGSPAIDAGNPATCTASDQRGVARPQGDRCDMGAYEKTELIFVEVGTGVRHSHSLALGQSLRVSYAGVNGGPVRFANTVPGQQLIAGERFIYQASGVNTSYSEIMALPASQLSTIYWLPFYNNVDLDTRLHIGNVSNSPATVHVFIGGVEMAGSPFNLAARTSTTKSYSGVSNGPVKIQSNVNIVASERVIYNVSGAPVSYSEMIALPNGQLNNIYWLPWYNNVGLNTQLRIANAGNAAATVQVFIAGTLRETFQLPAGQNARKSYVAANNGPVKIVSTQNIVVSQRVIYTVNGVNTSYSETMALPNSLLNSLYTFPFYNSIDLNTQFRIANVSGSPATVRVFVGGVELAGSPFNVAGGTSMLKNFPGVRNGPVKIQSTQPIVVTEEVVFNVNGTNTSFTEIMGLPNSLLSAIHWLPIYNNVDLDTQLRFGVP